MKHTKEYYEKELSAFYYPYKINEAIEHIENKYIPVLDAFLKEVWQNSDLVDDLLFNIYKAQLDNAKIMLEVLKEKKNHDTRN